MLVGLWIRYAIEGPKTPSGIAPIAKGLSYARLPTKAQRTLLCVMHIADSWGFRHRG